MTCRCTLHPRKHHIDACRACAFQHFPASRDADVSAIPVADVPRRHREASDTLRGHAAVPGASLRPALVSGTSSEGASALTASMPVDKLADRIDRSAGPEACWPWLGSRRPKGYGHVWVNGRDVPAHRVVLEAAIGRRLLPSEDACHRCDNPPCCNPAHLFAGTRTDNMRDASAKGRRLGPPPRSHCQRGHDLSVFGVRWGDGKHRKCRECARLRKQTIRPSEGALMLRNPSSAPTRPLSAGTRSRTAGGGR